MFNFQNKLNSEYYIGEPDSEFWNDLENETKRLQSENRKFDEIFNRNVSVFKLAKSLEKSEPYKAIELYESIKNTNYGNFDTLSRLIILYRKTKQKEKEIQHLEYKLEEEQNTQYNRMCFLKNRFPNLDDEIESNYNNQMEFTTPELQVVNFHSKIEKIKKNNK